MRTFTDISIAARQPGADPIALIIDLCHALDAQPPQGTSEPEVTASHDCDCEGLRAALKAAETAMVAVVDARDRYKAQLEATRAELVARIARDNFSVGID